MFVRPRVGFSRSTQRLTLQLIPLVAHSSASSAACVDPRKCACLRTWWRHVQRSFCKSAFSYMIVLLQTFRVGWNRTMPWDVSYTPLDAAGART